MNKRVVFICIILVLIVLLGSVSALFSSFAFSFKESDDSVKTLIDDSYLNVKYVTDQEIDEDISFNNIYSSIIKIENTNDKDIVFSIKIKDLKVSNDKFTSAIYASFDGENFNSIYKEETLSETVGYNLKISKNSVLYIKVDIKSTMENTVSEISGKLSVESNITEKEKFMIDVDNIISKLYEKIDEKNGINQSGTYIINVDELSDNYKGYIVIDAIDYSNPDFVLFIYNDYYYVDNVRYSKINKNKIIKNEGYSLDENTACYSVTKNGCSKFDSIEYNELGGKKNFYNDSVEVLEEVKKEFNNAEKKVYIYNVTNDITNSTNIRGFILIDNTKDTPEYYLYITNNIYMISGYNISKYGDYSSESTTIRSYVESAYNLSSLDALTVCRFSGFSECYDKNNNLIQ